MHKPPQRDWSKVGNIPKETLDYLAEQKNSPKRSKSALVGFVTLAVLFLLIAAILNSFFSDNKASSVRSAEPVRHAVPMGNGRSKLANCDLVAAEQVLGSATRMAYVQESSSGATYAFRSDWWSTIEPKVRNLMEGIADADACKHKEARMIIFQDPTGNEIGRADPISGLRFD